MRTISTCVIVLIKENNFDDYKLSPILEHTQFVGCESESRLILFKVVSVDISCLQISSLCLQVRKTFAYKFFVIILKESYSNWVKMTRNSNF